MNNRTPNYLEDFFENPKIIDTELLPTHILEEVPEWWKRCMNVSDKERIDLVVEEWRNFEELLPITFTYLENNLSEVLFVSHRDSALSMIYTFVFHGAVRWSKKAGHRKVLNLATYGTQQDTEDHPKKSP